MKKEFSFLSCNKQTRIHAIAWIPSGPVKAILQISHGMVEYIDRYDELASCLCQKGYLVVGQDHLGHGASVLNEEDHGYFHKTHGNAIVLGDIHKLYLLMKKHFPSTPYFMLGHSMGSFLLRQYLQTYSDPLNGAIIMGTGNQPAPVLISGIVLCKLITLFKGDRYRSRLINNMAFGSYNRLFKPARTSYDWLTRDTEQVDKYAADPLCTFIFTANAYYNMFRGMLTLTRRKNLERIPKDLPIFLVSGADDPVGGFGKGVTHVFHEYQKLHIQDVSMKLYPTDRHEIIRELDKETVFEDLAEWLDHRTKTIIHN